MKPFAIITGTTQGLGKELAAAVRSDRDVATINRHAIGVGTTISCDFSDSSVVQRAKSAVLEAVGGRSEIEFWLNAGTYGDDEIIQDITPTGLGELIYANVFGQLALVEAVLAADIRVKLVAVSSAMGSIALAPETYHFAYCASKAALNLSIRLLRRRDTRLEYVLVDPGWMRTQMGGSEATEDPKQVAQDIVQLAQDPANWNRSDGMIQATSGEIIPW